MFFCRLLGIFPFLYGIGLILFFLHNNQLKALLYIMFLSIHTYLIAVLKSIYSMPRPYFVFDNVEGLSCSP